MTKAEKLTVMKQRLAVLEGRGNKNVKCPGVMRKLRRQIRNLEQ